MLRFTGWSSSIRDPLIELFAAYATLQEFCPTMKTVSSGVGVLCGNSKKGRGPILAADKVKKVTTAALNVAIAAVGSDRASGFYEETLARIQQLQEPNDAISGKDFLLPLVHFHLYEIGCRLTRRSLRMRLATSCTMARFAELRHAVLQAASGAWK
jgi:hypothetical protein